MSEKDWAVNEAANLVATGIECFTELDGTATARANLNIVADTLRRIYARGRVAGLREAQGIAFCKFRDAMVEDSSIARAVLSAVAAALGTDSSPNTTYSDLLKSEAKGMKSAAQIVENVMLGAPTRKNPFITMLHGLPDVIRSAADKLEAEKP